MISLRSYSFSYHEKKDGCQQVKQPSIHISTHMHENIHIYSNQRSLGNLSVLAQLEGHSLISRWSPPPLLVLCMQLGLLTALQCCVCVPKGALSFKKLLCPENWKVLSISHTICCSHIKLISAKIESSFMWLVAFTFTFFKQCCLKLTPRNSP